MTSLRAKVLGWLEPLVECLQEWLGMCSGVLYLLERYKRRPDFDRARLFGAYEADPALGQCSGEQTRKGSTSDRKA